MPHLSVVIPVYNGAATLGGVVADCYEALKNIDFELVLVNDGSTDNSEEMLFSLAKQQENIKAISLAKNVGEFNAVLCGLNYATGHYVSIIDDDGQNPPKEILKLLAEAEKGYDVVYARYEQKQHSWWRNLGSDFSNFTAWLLLGKPFNLYLSSFKVMRKSLVNKVAEYRYGVVYLDSFIFREYPKVSITEAVHKNSGRSRYSFARLMKVFYAMYMCSKRKYMIWVVAAFVYVVLDIISSLLKINLGLSVTGYILPILFVFVLTVRQDYIESQKQPFIISKKSF